MGGSVISCSRCDDYRAALIYCRARVQALNDDLNAAFKRWYPAPWECTTLHLPPRRRKATSHRNANAAHSRPRTSRLCIVSAEPSASRPSLSAWAPKPITVNHRGGQFFARACNRDGVINPANSLERCLLGTQDGAMLGGVVAPERVDDNACHWRILNPEISVTSNNPPKLGIRDSRACINDFTTSIVLGCAGTAPCRNSHDVGVGQPDRHAVHQFGERTSAARATCAPHAKACSACVWRS